MDKRNLEIKYQSFEDILIATVRRNIKDREEVQTVLTEIKKQIPEKIISGPPFCLINFVTSVTEGLDAELGFPVSKVVEMGEIQTRNFSRVQVLTMVHNGALKDIGQSYSKLYGYASGLGIISDEFCREIYLSSDEEGVIEIQFIIHDWNGIFSDNLNRRLGCKGQQHVMNGSEKLTTDTRNEDRFWWTKGAIERLENLVEENDRYDILSKCAHVFPESQINKLKEIYENSKQRTGNALAAVDAVIDFMGKDPGWGEQPRREGYTLYSSKNPRDPAGYEKAENALERKKAYCFCPLVREYLELGMPVTFCYCGSGWYRQQWEGATGKPVTIEIVQSLLKGDELCEFAIHLSDDLD